MNNKNKIEITSEIYLPEEIAIDDMMDILLDIECHISEYVKEKYNAVTNCYGK